MNIVRCPYAKFTFAISSPDEFLVNVACTIWSKIGLGHEM